MEEIIQLNNQAKLSEHFTLGELTKTSHKVYNIPSHEAIANLKRVCEWLEYLRKRYNELNQTTPGPSSLFEEGNPEGRVFPSSWEGKPSPVFPSSWEEGPGVEERKALLPIIINSGYRSPQLNKKIGGQPNSNHLTGCAVDIRVKDNEQLITYAAILIQYANENGQDFDELLLEKNSHGAIWLHFAVKPNNNRRHVLFLTS